TLSRHRETITQQARSLQIDTILAGLDILSSTRSRLQYSSHGRTLVEMALVRLGRLGPLLSISPLTQMLGQLASGGSVPTPATPTTRAGAAGRAVSPPEVVKKNNLNPAAEAPTAPVLLALSPETLPQVWGQVLAQVGGMLALQLERAGLPAIFGPNTL